MKNVTPRIKKIHQLSRVEVKGLLNEVVSPFKKFLGTESPVRTIK